MKCKRPKGCQAIAKSTGAKCKRCVVEKPKPRVREQPVNPLFHPPPETVHFAQLLHK